MKVKNKFSLKRRFLLLYATLVLIPFVILSVMLSGTSVQYLQKIVGYTAKASFRQTAQFLEYYISNVTELTNSVIGVDEFHRIVEKDNSKLSTQDQIKDMLMIRNLLNSCCSGTEIMDAYLYIENDAIYIGDNAQVRHLSDITDETWYHYVESSYPKSSMIPGEYLERENSIAYARVIRHSRDYAKTVGVLLFYMNRDELCSYLGDSKSTQVAVINEYDDRVIQSKGSEIKLSVSELKQYADGEAHVIRDGKDSYFLYTRKIEKTDWYLVHLEPYETLFQMIMTHGRGYVIGFGLILIMGLVFFYLFFKVYLKRITDMTKHMSKIHEKLPLPMIGSAHQDEIDDLVSSYNYMIRQMERMMKEQYELGNQIKEIEMKALYEQINPHFLYNTLTMINWLAEDGQTEDVSSVITALSGFYRLSLNKGKENIYLREELEIAKNFIYIQQMRFGTDIRLECEIDSVYETFVIPKLTLQPLIENALVHGILMRRDKCGQIRVSVEEESGVLHISVSDNGIGMSAEQVEKLNNGTLQSSGNHYGVWNVVKRASLYYGSNCTIQCSSEEMKGTTVVLLLPYRDA